MLSAMEQIESEGAFASVAEMTEMEKEVKPDMSLVSTEYRAKDTSLKALGTIPEVEPWDAFFL